jgi:hypothetical protein
MLTPICGRPDVVRIEQIAEAAINQDALSLRSLTQDFLRERPTLKDFTQPTAVDFKTLAAAAALIELFAERLHQEAPAWTREIGALPEPIYLVKAAATMKHLRALCELEGPEPLRKRGFYAPPNFLESA